MTWTWSLERNHRLVALSYLFRFVTPPILLGIALSRFIVPHLFGLQVTWGVRTLLFVALFPIYWTLKINYDILAKKRDAKSRGAVLAPEIKGKWPGNLDLLLRLRQDVEDGYVGKHLETLFKEAQADTVNLRILWTDMLFTQSHHNMQAILATQFDDFQKGPLIKLRAADLFGEGIFTQDGKEWKAHRALTKPFFARERVRDFDLFDRYSDKVINIFRERALANESLDVQDIFGRFTLDAAGEFLFNTTTLNTLDLPLPRAGRAVLGPKGVQPEGTYGGFVRAFEEIQTISPARFRRSVTLWPFFELWKNAADEHNKVIDEWVGPWVEEALEAKRKRAQTDAKMAEDEGSLTDHIAQSTDDVKAIRDETMNILLAARDTTAALMTFLLYMLSLHPTATAKLREEIISAVPTNAPTFEDIRSMKYLRACLNETLRLFPPVPINERASARPTTLPAPAPTRDNPNPKPIFVPGPDITVVYTDLLMQRRKDLWGEDADEFKPERWIEKDRLAQLTKDPFRFLPFNAGPRICLGQNFAYNEASFLTVRLLQSFSSFELRQREDAPAGSLPPASWKERGGRNPVEVAWPRVNVTMYSKGGMWIVPKLAKSASE